jgi:hypothetical protein
MELAGMIRAGKGCLWQQWRVRQGVPIRCFWSRITYDTRMIRDTPSIRSCDTLACASSEQQQQD